MFPSLVILFTIHLVLGKECNVINYGAKGDGKTLDTESIQKAMNDCASSTEMNTILFPSGHNFLTFPFQIMASNTILQIDATITCPMDANNWPVNSASQYQTLITTKANSINNLKITGSGLINGNGFYWYPMFWNQTLKHMRPCLIGRCYGGSTWNNVEISDITLLNSPMYFIHASGNNISIHDINITVVDSQGNPGNYNTAPNTDGIDIGGTNVHIYNCYIQNGDDSFTLESGANGILIENSTCAYGLGLGIPMACGQPWQTVTENSIYRNMLVYKTWWGIRIKACGNIGNQWNGTVQNITYQNITFVDVKYGIDINVYNQTSTGDEYDTTIKYDTSTGDEYDTSTGVGYSKVTNVIFEDIKGTITDWVGHLDCSNSPPCTDLQFRNIDLKMDGNGDDKWECSNNVFGTASNVSPPLTCLK